MSYTPFEFEPGVTKITAAWANKIESHMSRLGTFLGVFDSFEDLPDAQTNDWAIVKNNIYVYDTEWVTLLKIDWNTISNKPNEFKLNPNTYFPRETYQYWIHSLKSVINNIYPKGQKNAFLRDGVVRDPSNEFYAEIRSHITPFAAWQFRFPSPEGKFLVEVPPAYVYTYSYWINFHPDVGTLLYLGTESNGYALKIGKESGIYTLEFETRRDGNTTAYITSFPEIFFESKGWIFAVFEIDIDANVTTVFFNDKLVLRSSIGNAEYQQVYFSGAPNDPHPWDISCPMIIKGNIPWTENGIRQIVERMQPFI